MRAQPVAPPARGLRLAACLVLGLCGTAFGTVLAQPPAEVRAERQFSEKQLAQQQRMRDCAAEAKAQNLRGEARPAYMKTCLSGGTVTVEIAGASAVSPAPEEPGQRQRLRRCRGESQAQGLQGEPRRRFMSRCLSGQDTQPPPGPQADFPTPMHQ